MNITSAKKSLLRGLGCAAFVFLPPQTHAAVYEFSLGDPADRTLRLNVPEGLPVVRGLLIFGNGYLGDSRHMATNQELVGFAESMGFAVLATARWTNFSFGYTPSAYSKPEYSLGV
jgi:hypothetical protein